MAHTFQYTAEGEDRPPSASSLCQKISQRDTQRERPRQNETCEYRPHNTSTPQYREPSPFTSASRSGGNLNNEQA